MVAVYFCLAVFSLLVLPRIEAEMNAPRRPTRSEERQRELNVAMSEAMERIMREEGEDIQAVPMQRKIQFPLGPLVLVLGVWLLARREARISRSDAVCDMDYV